MSHLTTQRAMVQQVCSWGLLKLDDVCGTMVLKDGFWVISRCKTCVVEAVVMPGLPHRNSMGLPCRDRAVPSLPLPCCHALIVSRVVLSASGVEQKVTPVRQSGHDSKGKGEGKGRCCLPML